MRAALDAAQLCGITAIVVCATGVAGDPVHYILKDTRRSRRIGLQ